jgi:hypothetical protein
LRDTNKRIIFTSLLTNKPMKPIGQQPISQSIGLYRMTERELGFKLNTAKGFKAIHRLLNFKLICKN